MKTRYRLPVIVLLSLSLFYTPLLTEAQNISDYTAYPPFITSTVKPNVLLMIDNSASMNDNQYFDESGSVSCFDNTFDKNAAYYGYFKENEIYQWDSGSETFIEKGAALAASCDHRSPYLCVDIPAGSVTTFEATGSFLNWVSASKMDILKKILTGGKYIEGSGYLQAESRGCDGRRTIKAPPDGDFTAGGAITFASRGKIELPTNPIYFSYGGNTVIEVFDGSFDPTPCQAAATLIDDSQGAFKQAVDDCLNMATSDDKDKIKGEGSTFNHTIHGCYKKKQGDDIPAGTVSSVQNSCEKLYADIGPNDIQPWSPAYICADRSKTCTNSDPMIICNQDNDCPAGETCEPSGLSGFLGQCYAEANPKADQWSKKGVCEMDMLASFCDSIDIPEMIDPTELTSGDEEQMYLPAFLTESGLFSQAGYPAGVFPARVTADPPSGVIQQTRDSARIGVMQFNYCGSASETGSNPSVDGKCENPDFPLAEDRDGGLILSYIGDASVVEDVNSIEAVSWTPFAEAYYNAIAYFVSGAAADNPALDPAKYSADPDAIQEPLNEEDFTGGNNPIQYHCQKNNVIIISDGMSTTDLNTMVSSKISHLSGLYDDDDGNDFTACGEYSGSTYLDDLSYYAANRNIFDPADPDPGDDDNAQRITTHVVYTGPAAADPADECESETLMKNTAANSGTQLYTPQNPEEMTAVLKGLMITVTDGAASSSSVSVLATTGEGSGTLYQAYFTPQVREDGEPRNWFGYLHSLFVDKYGNIRENNSNPSVATLDDNDNIIRMVTTVDNDTEVYKCNYDINHNVTCPATPEPDGLDSIVPVWDAGERLWSTLPADRRILTTLNGSAFDFDLTLNPTKGNFQDDPDNVKVLMPYLRAADLAESANIINWTRGVRGADLPAAGVDAGHPEGYRKRDITRGAQNREWKLGDIIYSTPTVVGRPMENYDLLYGDSTYAAYRQANRNRLHAVYVGANDGMLHVFNGGCYNESDQTYYPDVSSVTGKCTTGIHSLGQELWSFIPRGLLPHLKWLSYPDYTHSYYVDLKPKVADAKIFSSLTHKEGWGTILIGGFRLGGKKMEWSAGGKDYISTPEYFALDITDPLNPRVLWTFPENAELDKSVFTDPGLGLTMSYPAVAKVGNDWYAVFGSGAEDYTAGSDLLDYQNGSLFILKISGGDNGVIKEWVKDSNYWVKSTGKPDSYLSDPITVDVDLDMNVDVIYVGENYGSGTAWNGLMRRITTGKGTASNPLAWDLSTLGNMEIMPGSTDAIKTITAAPSAAMDRKSNLWVFFGTGRFYGVLDKNQTDSGGFYAIKDRCWAGSCSSSGPYANLLDISDAEVRIDGNVSGITGSCGGSTWSTLLSGSYSCDGWALYFSKVREQKDYTNQNLNHTGERMFSKPLVLGGLVTFTTYIPGTDQCNNDGESNLYALYYETGTAYNSYVFKDQLFYPDTKDVVARVKRLGHGLPSSVSAMVTSSGTTKGFVQSQSGGILQVETESPFSLQSGLNGWVGEQIQ